MFSRRLQLVDSAGMVLAFILPTHLAMCVKWLEFAFDYSVVIGWFGESDKLRWGKTEFWWKNLKKKINYHDSLKRISPSLGYKASQTLEMGAKKSRHTESPQTHHCLSCSEAHVEDHFCSVKQGQYHLWNLQMKFGKMILYIMPIQIWNNHMTIYESLK